MPRSQSGISARGSHSPEKNISTKNSTPPTALAALLVKLTAATSSPSVLVAAASSTNATMKASGWPIEALNAPVAEDDDQGRRGDLDAQRPG